MSKKEKDKAEMRRVSYASVVGSLMYVMVCTWPDIAFVVGTVRGYMSNPGNEHWAAVKWILIYLKGTSRVCLGYGSGKPMLEGFTYSDMSGDVDSNWSTSGYVMTYARGSCVMAIKIAKGCGFDHNAWVNGCSASWKGIDLDEEFSMWIGMEQEKFLLHCDNMRETLRVTKKKNEK